MQRELWPPCVLYEIGFAFSFGRGRDHRRTVRRDSRMESRAIEAAFNWVLKSCLDGGRNLTYRNADVLSDARAILGKTIYRGTGQPRC